LRLLKWRDIDMALPRRLKGWLDPRGVLAPGRYLWAEDR
jgi:hypothetical protein